MLHRREVVSVLLKNRPQNLLAVAGLGSSAWDLTASGDDPRNFHFIGAMGQAAPFALGLALAQPKKRVVLFTGDGDMLMSLGSLATIANQAPKNFVLVVLDNEAYFETGGQATATAGPTDLASVAKGAGIESVVTIEAWPQIAILREKIQRGSDLHFAAVKVGLEKLPLVFPYSFDGVTAINRFRGAVLEIASGGQRTEG